VSTFENELIDQFGSNAVIIGNDIPEKYFSDWMTTTPVGTAIALVRPSSTEEVSSLLRLCNSRGIPVVPQGGLTGLAGGAKPVKGCVLISMERMNQIESIDLPSSTISVQAGVTMGAVQRCAKDSGLFFPLDLGGRDSCTIGGNLSTNAGGNRVLRYGMARDLILGLEVVLADGTILSHMNLMLKDNTGYDLKQLFVGSEGTLGVITKAVLKLFPQPRSTNTALCALKDYDAVLKLLTHVRQNLGANLSAFEMMWPDFYERMTSGLGHLTTPMAYGHGAYVLIEAQGTSPESDKDHFEHVLEETLEREIVEDVVVAQSESDALKIWAVRDSSGEFRAVFWPHVGFDVSIPTGQIGNFVEDLKAQLKKKWPDTQTVFFGHVGDSNVHIGVKVKEGDQPEEEIEDFVYSRVGEWRGSISAEHGIGTLKREYLHHSRSPAELQLMKLLKTAMDPQNILNPGKVIQLS
jgi:FAD/FMN-containing dehydrogenase